MAWRSGGRQRAMWRNVKGERRADAEAALALATACDESRAYAESIQSAAELKERRLYEEKEEARQLAVAMAQSAAESGGWTEGQFVHSSWSATKRMFRRATSSYRHGCLG